MLPPYIFASVILTCSTMVILHIPNPTQPNNPFQHNTSQRQKMASSPKEPRVSAKSTPDPILRNALRYTISAKEYETLHTYIISRSKVLKRNAPTVAKVERLVEYRGEGTASGDDPNAAAVRASLRVFLATGAALKVWKIVGERFLGREGVRFVLSQVISWMEADAGIGERKYRSGRMRISDWVYRWAQFCYCIEYYSGSSLVYVLSCFCQNQGHSDNGIRGRVGRSLRV